MSDVHFTSVPAEPQGGGQGLTGAVHAFVRNSPWIAIAVAVHVIGFAVLGVIYMATHEKEEPAPPSEMRLASVTPDLPDPIEDVPEPIDREAVLVFEEKDAGPVNPSDDYIADAPAGKPGEITDETDPTNDAGIDNPNPDAIAGLPSGEPSGTSIGVGIPGHRAIGGPSPWVTRMPGAGGRGKGGIGQMGGGGHGGLEIKMTDATDRALRWLKKHQSPDGRWDADGFDQQCTSNRCPDAGESVYDPGLTGLSLLCFLGAGETHLSDKGPYRTTVRQGVKYLKSIQDAEGCFGPRTSQHFQYNHSTAALAMAEAYGMTQSSALKDSAQRGINFVHQSQNPYLAWRYGVRDGDNDTSVTGWMVMALKSGVMAGLEVDKGAFRGAQDWIDKMTDLEFGKTGYQQRGGACARTTAMQDKFPASNSESLTAVGVLTRIFTGRTFKDDPMILKGADLMLRQLPKWDDTAGTIDFYYWYYGTLAMYQVGGEHWKKWSDALANSVLKHQRTETDRCEDGSWDAVDPWSPEGGRVYATTLNCLSMEIHKRYANVFGTR